LSQKQLQKMVMVMADAGAPEFTCPHCHRSWAASSSLREAMLRELMGWDARFDRPETIVEAILELVAEDQGREVALLHMAYS
jgi:hypothetical protein